ncbi:hypothetical protein J0B02_05825 [Enterobacteriaceae bacterium YMB-R22]|uniref:hypothetical protein n=1 Tax=Tenebrionicola larvae TaxID=2815733 RepID=UPI0020124CD1|nr:hypothetical protein [Tenebrionicola larvae]MBV4412351.1 hypothetical protein [Tenebrionicola larvae]
MLSQTGWREYSSRHSARDKAAAEQISGSVEGYVTGVSEAGQRCRRLAGVNIHHVIRRETRRPQSKSPGA